MLAEDEKRARELLPEAQRLATLLKDHAACLHLRWIEGVLNSRNGDWMAAEPLFKEARAGFIELSDLGMVAVASLDLALLCHEEGERSDEVMAYAAEALPALEALKIPEAYAALELLREAIREGEMNRSILKLARHRLVRLDF